MKLFTIEPEVAGEIGENTVYGNYIRGKEHPVISHLHFVFDGWLGDDILETTPCFLVSERLKITIENSGLTGYEFQDVGISTSDEWDEMYPDREVPHFCRLIPLGTVNVEGEKYSDWNNMDFCLTPKSYLVISENAKKLLEEFQTENADFTELSPL